MKALSLVLILLCLLSCGHKKVTTIPGSLVMKVEFSLSFDGPVTINVNTKTGKADILSIVFKNNRLTRLADTTILSKQDIAGFFNDLDTLSLLNIPDDTSKIGFDGMSVMTDIDQDGKHSSFSTWSPKRKEKPIYYAFLDAVFNLAYKKFPNQKDPLKRVQEYLSYP